MKNKIFLTSVFAIGFAFHGFNANAETFPNDGYMLEDKVYAEAATYENIGVYDGAVSATAEYIDAVYNISAGDYLPKGLEIGVNCPGGGSYCPGNTEYSYNQEQDQGLESCPAGFPNSYRGARSINDCFNTSCALENANVAHATAVSGITFYNGDTECNATACENGYHLLSDIRVYRDEPVLYADYETDALDAAYIGYNGRQKGGYGLTEKGTWAVQYDSGVLFGRGYCTQGNDYVRTIRSLMDDSSLSVDEYRLRAEQHFTKEEAQYLAGLYEKVKAGSVDSSILDRNLSILSGGTNPDNLSQSLISEDSSNQTGECLCQVIGVGTDFSNKVDVDLPVHYVVGVLPSCRENCAWTCSQIFTSDLLPELRTVLVGGYGVETTATCEANTINITWQDADPSDVAANDAGMCTYDGDIRTPVKALKKPGKKFKGWKFIKTN